MKIDDFIIHASGGAVKDTLWCLFKHGPMWDGNVPSKSARDALCEAGLVEHEFGFAWLTRDGVEVCINLGYGRKKS